MKRSERLTPVLELAETREQQAARVLGEYTRQLETTRGGLDNLKVFRDGYIAKFRQSVEGLGMRQLLEYRAFIAKIDGAIEDQHRAVAKAEQELAKRQADWEAARQQTKGLRTVIDKARAEEAKAEDKRQQAEQDERASRRAGRDSGLLMAFL